jgi:hypothetical protein
MYEILLQNVARSTCNVGKAAVISMHIVILYTNYNSFLPRSKEQFFQIVKNPSSALYQTVGQRPALQTQNAYFIRLPPTLVQTPSVLYNG